MKILTCLSPVFVCFLLNFVLRQSLFLKLQITNLKDRLVIKREIYPSFSPRAVSSGILCSAWLLSGYKGDKLRHSYTHCQDSAT